MALLLLARIPSSSGSRKYRVTKDADLPDATDIGYACSCRGWTSKTPRRDCKHIKVWKQRMEDGAGGGMDRGWEVTSYGWRVAKERCTALFPRPPTVVITRVDRGVTRNPDPPQPVAAPMPMSGLPPSAVAQQPRVWPPLRSSLPDPNARPVRPVEQAPDSSITIKTDQAALCPTCGVVHDLVCEFCRLEDVEAKQRAEKEKEGNPLRYKLLEIL